MKLIPMIDYIIHRWDDSTSEEQFEKHVRYAHFLRQPLKPGMFVPCDEDGNVLKKPTIEEKEWAEKDSQDAEMSYKRYLEEYQRAKEKVLFKGFRYERFDYYIILIEGHGPQFTYHTDTKEFLTGKYKTLEDLSHMGLEMKKEIYNNFTNN